MWEKYISRYNYRRSLDIDALLPDYYQDRPIQEIDKPSQQRLHMMENMVISYLRSEDFEKALEMSEKMISLAPDDFRGYRMRAESLIYLDKLDHAISSYAKALECTSERSDECATVLADKSNVLLMAGRWEEALSNAQELLQIDPTEHSGVINKCIALTKLGEEEEAKKILQDTLPEIENHYYRACAFATLGDKQNMLRELRSAVKEESGYRVDAKIDPGFADYRKDPEFKKLVYEVEAREES
jgi:tetratricopeptide (TPR) repeat protein